jgi:Amt family ammonium transporter
MDGYYAWMLIATAIVLMMTTPALAIFYGGMTRSKSVLNMMMMSYISMGVVGIVFVLWGWSEGWGGDGAGNGNEDLIASPFKMFGLHGVSHGNYIYVLFQLTFAAITAALISGAIADRVKFSAWVIFLPIWVTICYFPVAHNVWGGGWLATKLDGEQDYAGGTVVHINAGIAALALILVIGPRVGFRKEPMKPHNLTLTMIGAGLLWMGWYGFNVGSIVFTADNFADGNVLDPKTGVVGAAFSAQFQGETGVTFLNTTIATCAAMLGWLVVERLVHGKATALGAASGIVAGLVAITPACGAVNLVGAIVVGGVAGILCALAVGLKNKLGYDDSLDVVGVHLVGGVAGTLLIGLVSTSDAPGGIDGLFYGGGWHSLKVQFLAMGFTILWTGILTTVIALLIKFTIGWKIKPEAEVEGIDFDQHGETAYDWGSSLAGSGAHLVKEGV